MLAVGILGFIAAERGVTRDALDWVIVVATLMALIFAAVELLRSGRITRAASDAVRRSEIRLANSTLSADFPRLRDLEQQLRIAAEREDRNEIRRLVTSFRYEVSRIAGVLDAQSTESGKNTLQRSIDDVRERARESLDALESQDETLSRTLTWLLNSITKAMDELSEHLGRVGASGDES